jgi:hypothetical protein
MEGIASIAEVGAFHGERSLTSILGRIVKKLGWTKRKLYIDGKYRYRYFPPARQHSHSPSTVVYSSERDDK